MGDVKIIFRTVGKVFEAEGVSAEGMDTAEDLGDWLLRSGKITREEYEAKQAQAQDLMPV